MVLHGVCHDSLFGIYMEKQQERVTIEEIQQELWRVQAMRLNL